MLKDFSKDWMQMDFYKHLNYSLGNEDWCVEAQALRVNSGDRAVCVTASGDRPLHLLMTDCAEVISIDMNHAQNYLFDLKMAAIATLDYEQYLAFMGCTPSPHRYAIYKNTIAPQLSSEAAAFWASRKTMLARGVVYQGRVERLTNVIAKLLHVFRGAKIKKLLTFDDIEAQRHFVKTEWDTKALRKAFELIIHPSFSKHILQDPGLNSYVEFANKPGLYIYHRMLNCLNTHLAKKSALLQLVFTGKVLPDAYFPYLTLDGYTKIRRSTGRVNVVRGNIVEYLTKSEPNQFDCFSMSDIASYMPQAIFEALLRGIHNAAKPNARFCIREFISKRSIPREWQAIYKRDPLLEKKLEQEEKNFVYRFIVGDIQK